jgi:hypothetical protein
MLDLMHRTVAALCTLLVGSAAGCDRDAAEVRASAATLAEKDRQIADLRAQLLAKSVPPAPETPASEPVAVGPGQLDPEIVRAAASGASKLKLELEADGTVRKLAVYHHDAAALPAVVTARAMEVYPGAEIRMYETEFYREHGRVFEVEVLTKDKQVCELSAKADGTLVYNECEVDPKTLPEPVKAGIAAAAPGLEIREAETKTYADGKLEFVVEVARPAAKSKKARDDDDDDDDHNGEELYLDAAGKLLRREITLEAEVEIAKP